jgi:hypothetical protein
MDNMDYGEAWDVHYYGVKGIKQLTKDICSECWAKEDPSNKDNKVDKK